MGDIVTDQGIASEFVKFLTAQLKESRDEVHRLNQENVSLKTQLERLSDGGTPSNSGTSSLVIQLRAEVNAFRKERDDALALAATRQAEADTWKTRYEELKPQLAESSEMNLQLLGTLRQELVQFISQKTAGLDMDGGSDSGDAAKFHTFIKELPATVVPDSLKEESRIVFKGVTKLPLLSKAAIKACIGGFAFFGTLLVWCPPPSQHACVVIPEYEYNPKPTAEDAATWTVATSEWASFAGQQRELFYSDGEDISYAGTFICHAGPRGANASNIGGVVDETLLAALAQKTLHLETKNPKARTNHAKTYTPLLANLYRDSSGPATVRLLGLQRVGFNKALFDILTAASKKRDRAAALAELLGSPDEGAESSSKRRCVGGGESLAMATDI